MPRISDTRGRSDENSGYTRLFGNPRLGSLMSRIHATVIRSGNELEAILEVMTPSDHRANLTDAIAESQVPTAAGLPQQVVFRPRMPGTADSKGGQADIAVFDHHARPILVIEIKDGDTFDTKKASGELANMRQFAQWIEAQTGYSATYHFCSFNQESKEAIVYGAKGRFGLANAMTGRELCGLLGLDYETIRNSRRELQPENLRFFVTQLLAIDEVRTLVLEYLGAPEPIQSSVS